MIGFTRRIRVFAYVKPTDMRKQYDGLYALVVSEMKADPLSGDLFLFTNRRRARAKVLLWDGYWAYDVLAREPSGSRLRLARCWAHVRRKSFEAEPFYPTAWSAPYAASPSEGRITTGAGWSVAPGSRRSSTR